VWQVFLKAAKFEPKQKSSLPRPVNLSTGQRQMKVDFFFIQGLCERAFQIFWGVVPHFCDKQCCAMQRR
jgi:hypothetical protein